MQIYRKIKYKIINKLSENEALTIVDSFFIFLISMIVLLLIMKAIELFAIVKNSRDCLERAALNVAAVNEYRLYENFRENIINDIALADLVTVPEVKNVLSTEYGLTEMADGMYKMRNDNVNYYYKLTNINADVEIEDNVNVDRYIINVSATLDISIGIFGYGNMDFNINVSCTYAWNISTLIPCGTARQVRLYSAVLTLLRLQNT